MPLPLFPLLFALAASPVPLVDHDPILITSDADLESPDLLAKNGVRGGSGTAADPYVISDWRIPAREGVPAIWVQGVTVHVRIDNVSVVVDGDTEAAVLLERGGRFDVADVHVSGGRADLWFRELHALTVRTTILPSGSLVTYDTGPTTITRNQLGDGSISVSAFDTVQVTKNQARTGARDPAVSVVVANVAGQAFPVIVDDNTVRHAAYRGVSVSGIRDGTVCDNLVLGIADGEGVLVLMDDEASGVQVCRNVVHEAGGVALDVTGGRSIAIHNNTMRDSDVGFDFQNVDGLFRDNLVVGNDLGVLAFGQGDANRLRFRLNLFLENEVAASSGPDGTPYDLRENYWGTSADPKAAGEQTGANRVEGSIRYSPWCLDPECLELSGVEGHVPSAGLGALIAAGLLAALIASRRQKT